jgi:hypothetical protein
MENNKWMRIRLQISKKKAIRKVRSPCRLFGKLHDPDQRQTWILPGHSTPILVQS